MNKYRYLNVRTMNIDSEASYTMSTPIGLSQPGAALCYVNMNSTLEPITVMTPLRRDVVITVGIHSHQLRQVVEQ